MRWHLLFVLFLVGCSTPQNIGIDVTQDYSCSYNPVSLDRSWPVIVNSQQEYDTFNMQREQGLTDVKAEWGGGPRDWCEIKKPAVDFEQYLLIGMSAHGSGCSTNFSVAAYESDQPVFHITIREYGGCLPLRSRTQWMLVPASWKDKEIEIKTTIVRDRWLLPGTLEEDNSIFIKA